MQTELVQGSLGPWIDGFRTHMGQKIKERAG